MKLRLIAGAFLSYLYTSWIGRFPSHVLRHSMLRLWLGRFGEKTSVQMGCRFINGRKVHLGKRNVINSGCVFDGRRYEIRVGDDVSIGPAAVILTLGHDPQSPDFADRGGPVIIGSRAWIAYGAMILPGVTIGEGSVVAARAVVTKDVEPYTIVGGSPARKLGERNRKLDYRFREHRPWFG